MDIKKQFERVTAMCEHLKAERGSAEYTPNEVVSVVSAYMIACDRTERFHHLEDAPKTVFIKDDVTKTQGDAWEAVWNIIGAASNVTNKARYTAAWDVWGVMLHSDECPGMQANTF
jgi:hypothetical protein